MSNAVDSAITLREAWSAVYPLFGGGSAAAIILAWIGYKKAKAPAPAPSPQQAVLTGIGGALVEKLVADRLATGIEALIEEMRELRSDLRLAVEIFKLSRKHN